CYQYGSCLALRSSPTRRSSDLAGEILGVAGVAGNGQSELLDVLAGIRPATGGTVRLDGQPLDLARSTNGDERRAARVAHVPEDRSEEHTSELSHVKNS